MVRAYKQEHVYRHPWDRVTAASWRKFTDSPAVLSHVTDVHTLARRLDPGGGILRATRSITVRSPQLPFLLSRLIGQDSVLCHCVESTVVDAQARSMEIVIRNGSLRNLIEVEERSRYNPHPADPDRWTMFQQETSIRCRPLSALTAIAEKVEQRCAERFLQNSAKGREVIERIYYTPQISTELQTDKFDNVKFKDQIHSAAADLFLRVHLCNLHQNIQSKVGLFQILSAGLYWVSNNLCF